MELTAENPFTAVLADGETLLWMGQPDMLSYRQAHRKEPVKIIAWLLFALAIIDFMALRIYASGGLTITWIALASFLNAGAIFFAGYMIKADRTFTGSDWHYAVTNKRVLFHHPAEDGLCTEKLALDQITKVYLQPETTAICALVFERKLFLFLSERIDFYISDVIGVQKLVVSLLTGVRQETRK